MLNTRPRNSGGALSWIRVITNGVKNPKLAAPTNNKIIHDAQNQGDQANMIKNTEKRSTAAMSSLALYRISPSEASTRLPTNDPRPAASNSKPVPPASPSSTSLVKAGMT